MRRGNRGAVFRTGDATLDHLLEDARRKFLSPREEDRRDALEKLWDTFERIKTLEPGKDKRAQTDAFLDRVTSRAVYRSALGTEAKELSDLGKNLRIRHSETDKEEIESSEQVDYLFERLFGLVRLLLRMTSRGG